MDGCSDLELLQRYRRDRRELLNFLLAASVIQKVVMPPGAVSYDDIDLDQISVDYILECARKNSALDLSEAIKRYHDELNLSPSRRMDVEDELDDFDDEDDEDEVPQKSNRALNDISNIVLALPSFSTGLSDDDLRETAYEVLLVSVGAAGGLTFPTKKSKMVRNFTRNQTEKYVPAPTRAPGLVGLMETMRTHMEISGISDRRTREAILHASAGRLGRRMDTLVVPLELLSAVPLSAFPDRIQYVRWSKRQMSLLLEGLLNHPFVGIDLSDRSALDLTQLIAKLKEAETLPSPAGPAQHTESLRAIRSLAISLAERAGTGDHIGEVCHWADGYHLNVRIYEKLLMSVFDVLDEGQLVEEADEILEMLKSTWRVLGITQTVHDTCYTWVLFRQHVLTGEPALLLHAAKQMKRIASDNQRSTQEKSYMKGLRATVEGPDGPQELSYVQSVLLPIKQWADKQIYDNRLHSADAPSKMEVLVTVAMVSGRLLTEENDLSRVARMTSAAGRLFVPAAPLARRVPLSAARNLSLNAQGNQALVAGPSSETAVAHGDSLIQCGGPEARAGTADDPQRSPRRRLQVVARRLLQDVAIAAAQPSTTQGQSGPLANKKLRKNGNWSDAALKAALRAVDNGAHLKTAAEAFDIPVTSFRDHVMGKRVSRKRGRVGILTKEEEADLVAYLEKMQDQGQALTIAEIKHKVAHITRERVTPFKNGIPGQGWLRWFKKRHPQLSMRRGQRTHYNIAH